ARCRLCREIPGPAFRGRAPARRGRARADCRTRAAALRRDPLGARRLRAGQRARAAAPPARRARPRHAVTPPRPRPGAPAGRPGRRHVRRPAHGDRPHGRHLRAAVPSLHPQPAARGAEPRQAAPPREGASSRAAAGIGDWLRLCRALPMAAGADLRQHAAALAATGRQQPAPALPFVPRRARRPGDMAARRRGFATHGSRSQYTGSPRMKITDVECFVLLVPDYRTDACSSAQDNLVVKIHTDEGLFGIGETDTNPWVAKAMIEAPGTHIMGLGLKEMLIGADPTDVEGLWERMYSGSAMTGRRGLGVCAIGAIDMALWDLRGKAEGKPCWQLLGGALNPAITPYASLLPDGDTLDVYTRILVERAVEAQRLGFKAA